MPSINGEENIEDVLRSKGLKCICQLCQCGRFHKHAGCKLKLPTIGATFEEEKGCRMVSDYAARFQAYEPRPTHPIRHADELRKPNYQQPMEFNTTKQMSYQKFENPEVQRPCKLTGEIDKLMGGEFHDKTSYNDSFVGYAINPTKTARPSTVFKHGDGVEFNLESKYMNDFQKKEKVPQERFGEKPSHTFEILHPDHSKLPQNSLKNSVHDGRQCEKVRPCDMQKPNIDFGLHGEFDHTTTNGVHFQDYDNPAVRTSKRVSDQKREEYAKFDAISQKQADYKYDEKEAMTARGKRITAPPSLIQLSMEIPHDFKTVSNLSYHNWKPESFKRPAVEFKPSSSYPHPNEKIDYNSHSHSNYVSYGPVARTEIYHPPEFRKSSAKVSGETSYTACFPNHGKPERRYYGESHSSNLHLPPADRKFVGSSTMQFDYKPMKIEKRKSFKPTYKARTSHERISTATEYNERFLAQQGKQCSFPKHWAAQEAAKVKPEVTVP